MFAKFAIDIALLIWPGGGIADAHVAESITGDELVTPVTRNVHVSVPAAIDAAPILTLFGMPNEMTAKHPGPMT